MLIWPGPILQPQPDVYQISVSQKCSLLLLATSGLWTIASNEDIRGVIERCVAENAPADVLFDDLAGDEIVQLLNQVCPYNILALTFSKITKQIAEFAWSKYGSESAMCDDLSIVLIYLPEKDLAEKQQFYPTSDDRDRAGLTLL